MPARSARVATVTLLAALVLSGCAGLRREPAAPTPTPLPSSSRARTLEVTATAYNSVPSQTDGDSSITAFGIRLRPGMKVVAVSRDLEALGLTEGVRIRIDGVDGEWEVADRTAKRWTHRIDLYMGTDLEAARAWGKRKVTIRW
jgi:3D (Asp-Asp-Asp) domain-containing protein